MCNPMSSPVNSQHEVAINKASSQAPLKARRLTHYYGYS